MRTLFAALAAAFAVPAAAQTAPAADPHAGHAQHLQQTAPAPAQHDMMNHARMMEKCKDPHVSAEMMKGHGKHQAAPAQPEAPQPQHSH